MNLTEARIASARALLYSFKIEEERVFVPSCGRDSPPYDTEWAPDLPGHEAQRWECRLWLLKEGYWLGSQDYAFHELSDGTELIASFECPAEEFEMRAVAEVK